MLRVALLVFLDHALGYLAFVNNSDIYIAGEKKCSLISGVHEISTFHLQILQAVKYRNQA